MREIEAEFKKIATKSDSKIEDAQKVRKKLVKELKDAGRTGEASDVSKVFLMTRPEVTERVKDFNKINMTHNDAEIKKAQAELANLKTVLGSRTKELTNVVLLTKADKNQEITNFGKKRNWKVLRSIENASGNYDLIYEDRRTKDLIAATLPLGSKDIKVKRKTEHKQVIRPKPESKTFANKLKGELDKFIAKGKKLTEEDKEFFELEEKEASKKNVG